MSTRAEVREFLLTRRSHVTPESVGLPAGGDRRVPGLRREEVAVLAGVSVEYYGKLERGQIAGASDAVLNAVADVLHLDDAERLHLFNLRATAGSSRSRQRTEPPQQSVPAGVRQLIDSLDTNPAFLQNGYMELIGWNPLGRALYSEAFLDTGTPPNLARFAYYHRDRAERFYPSWDNAAHIMRLTAGRHPHDQYLLDLVDELSARSTEFRTRWASHNVTLHANGTKAFNHPVVGHIELSWESMNLPTEPDLRLVIYNAAPNSEAADTLKLLASWAATLDQDAAPAAAPRSATQRS